MNPSLHTWTWLGWLGAVLIAISLTRNPLYLGLILVCLLVVLSAIERTQQRRQFPFPLVRFGLVMILLSAVFNALTAHYGDTILFQLPQGLPIIGGSLTLEGLVYGAVNGLVLLAILIAFLVLVSALPVRKLVRLIPRAFHPVAVVTSIALTFIPNTLLQFRQVREAQAIRGHRMRGLRDWAPLLMPLLVGGLEHALQLAEAMTARGFSGTFPSSRGGFRRVLLLGGLGLALLGWLTSLTSGWEVAGWGLLLVGIAGIGLFLWSESRRIPHTTYIQESWHWQDALVGSATLILILMFFLPESLLPHLSIAYPVYPRLSMPLFDPWFGVAILLILLPAMLMRQEQG